MNLESLMIATYMEKQILLKFSRFVEDGTDDRKEDIVTKKSKFAYTGSKELIE